MTPCNAGSDCATKLLSVGWFLLARSREWAENRSKPRLESVGRAHAGGHVKSATNRWIRQREKPDQRTFETIPWAFSGPHWNNLGIASGRPAAPFEDAWKITRWQGGRLRLHLPLRLGARVSVGTVDNQWLEMTTAREAPRLGGHITVQSRNRIDIHQRGPVLRFGVAPDEHVLVREVRRGSDHLIQVAGLGLLRDVLDQVAHDVSTALAPQWQVWRRRWLADITHETRE